MSEPTNADVIAMLKKIQEQLDLLGRKVEALANKPQERSFSPAKTFSKPFAKPFSKPYKSFGDHAPRNDRSPREYSGSRDSKPSGQGRPYEKRAEGRPYEKRDEARPFDKRQGEEKRTFKPKFAPKYSTSSPVRKKPFPAKFNPSR